MLQLPTVCMNILIFSITIKANPPNTLNITPSHKTKSSTLWYQRLCLWSIHCSLRKNIDSYRVCRSTDVLLLDIKTFSSVIPNSTILLQAAPTNYSTTKLQPICRFYMLTTQPHIFESGNLRISLLTHVKTIECQQREVMTWFFCCELEREKNKSFFISSTIFHHNGRSLDISYI